GSDEGAIAVFQFANAGGQFECGGSAVEAVGIADCVLVPSVLDGGGVGEKNGGAAMCSGSEREKTFRSVGVGMDELGFPGFCHAESVAQRDGKRGKPKSKPAPLQVKGYGTCLHVVDEHELRLRATFWRRAMGKWMRVLTSMVVSALCWSGSTGAQEKAPVRV